jgi:Predicted metal-dependent hydrolase
LRIGTPPIEVHLRRLARARRLTLRVSQIDGTVTLTVPHCVGTGEAARFASSREGWLRATLQRTGRAQTVHLGGTVPFEGQPLPLVAAPVRAPVLADGALRVPADPSRLGPRVAAFLKTEARSRLVAATDRHAAALGRPYGRITLRDTRSRWGSCSAEGNLMYSWRVVMAPPEVLDYLVAHEVAHLAEMNHSPAFWDTVARLCPGFRGPRAWLRQQGGTLMQLRFDGA